MNKEDWPCWLEVGATFRDETGPKEMHTVYHVRAIVDDGQVVMRYWAKARWEYCIEPHAFFAVRAGNLTLIPPKEKAPGTG